jgi:IS5 family transposase
MEQVQYNLLFRWLIGLSMDDSVWVPTVFSKNRQRLIEHEVVVAFFNAVLAQAERRNWLSKEHFSVDGTLIQAWASHKSFVPKDSGDDNADGGSGSGSDFRGRPRSNTTHELKTDPDSRLYRKGKTASELRFMTLMENRNGLVVDATLSRANGCAERTAAKAMIGKVRQANPEAAITVGADKGYDAAEFIAELHRLKVTPHVAQNKSGRRSALADEVAQHEGYRVSLQCRKRIEQGFGWAKTIGRVRQVMIRGLQKVGQMFVLNMAAYNLVRMRSLGQVHLQGAQCA